MNTSSYSSSSDEEFLNSPTFERSFEHAARVTTLAESFSLTHFNPFQEQVLDATLAGKDSIIVQPTGSGKSLCFQFPPVYEQKKAIVVVPTISLMNDQVTNLAEKGIKAVLLGSAQLDKSVEDIALSPKSDYRLVFVTPEWIAKPEKLHKVKQLMLSKKLSLIAIDEAHLFHQWQEFRGAFKSLENLQLDFPSTPIMALTATAPPEVMRSIRKLVREPLVVRSSVNRPNIYLECEEIPDNIGKDDLSYFAMRVAEKVENRCTIIYTDFINNVGKIVSALFELGLDSVAYTGEMDVRSRGESYTRWRSGDVNIMVATSAFGMGVDKSDIQHIVRYGVPDNICNWAQELGRAGRGGQRATATIFYSMSHIDHAGAWIREHFHNSEHVKRVLKEFSNSWQYVMSHLAAKCRRQMLLELFSEEAISKEDGENCCDVCMHKGKEEGTHVDCHSELAILVDAIDTIGDKGEVKLAQWIRGTSLQWTNDYNKSANS
ncbi:MAG: RecQ family ATP-dependent DNA helicase [Gammaproteobacteria bacterium]|nr:RecQ family ATP-dependent DNA helicase [Gammaproteobacteria bacterium]